MMTAQSKNKVAQDMVAMKKKKGKGSLAKSTMMAREHEKVMEEHEAGTGARFKSLTEKLSKKPGIKNAAALAAAIGRKKFGKGRFQAMAASGKK